LTSGIPERCEINDLTIFGIRGLIIVAFSIGDIPGISKADLSTLFFDIHQPDICLGRLAKNFERDKY